MIEVVGAVFYDQDLDSFLVAQRAEGLKFPLKWEFIGGKREENDDDLFKAVEREVKEEINKQVKATRILGTSNIDYAGDLGNIMVYFIECVGLAGEVTKDPKIHNQVLWEKREKMGDIDWVEGDIKFAKTLANGK